MADYICCECGYHFEKPKELDYGFLCLNGPATGCPICGGAYERAERCENCKEEFLHDQLFEGLCQKCLDVKLTPKNGFLYMNEIDCFYDFMFYQFFDGSSTPKRIAPKLRDHLQELYMQLSHDDPLGMQYHLRCYLWDPDGTGQQNFAEWLREKEQKEGGQIARSTDEAAE